AGGPVVAKRPPARIEETPPDYRPDGDNVVWIPGYWAWSDDDSTFIWVSGLWRDVPPGRQWEPGYWARVTDGYQWVSGYWSDTAEQQIAYLPDPPASLENGPNTDPPTATDTWVPGVWVWSGQRYAWRPGYWGPYTSGWIWVPAHYVWTPAGCVFVEGFWDYALARRGLCFAPVYFTQAGYTRPGF